MTIIGQILLPTIIGLITGLAVSEFSEVCPWAACKFVRWSAHRRYSSPAYAEIRVEELAAYIGNRPGKLFKLFTALAFAVKAFVTRKVGPTAAPPDPPWWPTTPTVLAHYDDGEGVANSSICSSSSPL